MFETQKNSQAIPEYSIGPGEAFDLDHALKMVAEHRLVRYQLGNQEEFNALLQSMVNEALVFHRDTSGKYPHQAILRQRRTEVIWKKLSGGGSRFVGVNGMVNRYEPGDMFCRHMDFPGKRTEDEVEPEEILTFLYVLSGSKDILFYTDGADQEPLRVTQYPGELYVFQGGDYTDGSVSTEGLLHEVPAQDTHNVTVTWELMPANRLSAE